jgi:hypothetical protein
MKTKLPTTALLFTLAISQMAAISAQAMDLNSAMKSDSGDRRLQMRGTFQASATAAHKVVFSFNEFEMKPGEVIYLTMPASAQGRILDQIQVMHKQDISQESECGAPNPRNDCRPAYTSVEILDQEATIADGDMWRYWGGVGSGPFNSKFAEIRSGEGETDSLYEWSRHGHLGTSSKNKSTRPLKVAGLRIRAFGSDSLVLQRVTVKLAPPMTTDIVDAKIDRALDFGDYLTAAGRHYPGRPSMGDYGRALVLENTRGRQIQSPTQLPPGWSIQGDVVMIPLDSGKILQTLDIACGDMRQMPDGANEEDYRGNGKVTVRYVHGDGTVEILMDRENVGTNGVMRAAALNEIKDKGGHLEVFANQGHVKVMGLRLAYKQ